MRIFNKPHDLRAVLKEVNPQKIAVAYVGGDWERYANQFKEIILSPTLGTNPKAIQEIIDVVGISNVHFLDNLHSKVYIGNKSAVLGSANLSKNGFSDDGNYEIFTLFDDAKSLDYLSKVYEDYLKIAKKMYPTEKDKIKKILELKNISRNAKCNNLNYDVKSSKYTNLSNYIFGTDSIHIAWFSGEYELNYNELEIENKMGMSSDKLVTSAEMIFSNEDLIKKGDWIILWKCTEKGIADKRQKLEWMCVDYVIENGVKDDLYKKLVFQSSDHDENEEPFKIDKKVNELIINLLNSRKYPDLVYKDKWSLNKADKFVYSFLSEIKAQLVGQADA